MKLVPIGDCEDCPFFHWYDITYTLECGKSLKQIRYKEIGADEALIELFSQCPLEEYPNSEIKLLNAFLVEKGFAEEYIRWKREGEQFEENIYTPSKKPMRFIGGKPLFNCR